MVSLSQSKDNLYELHKLVYFPSDILEWLYYALLQGKIDPFHINLIVGYHR